MSVTSSSGSGNRLPYLTGTVNSFSVKEFMVLLIRRKFCEGFKAVLSKTLFQWEIVFLQKPLVS